MDINYKVRDLVKLKSEEELKEVWEQNKHRGYFVSHTIKDVKKHFKNNEYVVLAYLQDEYYPLATVSLSTPQDLTETIADVDGTYVCIAVLFKHDNILDEVF